MNIPKKVSERFVKEVGRFQKVLQSAKDRDINEADTVTIVADILANVFGFDKYTEITGEHQIRGTYCDLAIKMNDSTKYLIEVKAIGIDLKDNHVRQAVNYGANNGIQWVILTNGIEWKVYRIKFEKPLIEELLCNFNFLELNARKHEDQDRLYIICREGLDRAAIEEFHEYIRSVNKFIIGAIIQGENVIDVIRKELRRVSPGIKVEREEIEKILASEVLKRDVLEGDAFSEAKARLKKSGKQSKKPKVPKLMLVDDKKAEESGKPAPEKNADILDQIY